jgi:thioredoxin-related protein
MNNRFNKIAFPLWGIVLLLVMPGVGLSGETEAEKSDGINWLDYSETMKQARYQNKNIMLCFTSSGDYWSDVMERDTFTDQKVINYLNEHFVVCKIDRERFPTLAKRYKVDAMPTLWFLNPKGKGLTSTDGFVPPRQILLIFEFIHKEIYKDITFKDWKEKQPRY